MASVNSPIRTIVKPFLFKLLGKTGYKYVQCKAKIRDIEQRLVEEKEMELLPFFVKEGDNVLDLGANYAYYVERLSKLVGEKGQVFAYEPIPFTHEVCEMIVKKLHLNNVKLYKYAAGNTNEVLKFRVPKLDFGGISAGQSHLADRNNEMEGKESYYSFKDEEIIECQSVVLDEQLKGVSNLSFVKIDIEGGEFFALQGMKNIIKQNAPAILVEIQPFFLKGLKIEEKQLIDLIKEELNYLIYHYDKTSKKLKEVTTNLWDDNYILLPKVHIDKYKAIIL